MPEWVGIHSSEVRCVESSAINKSKTWRRQLDTVETAVMDERVRQTDRQTVRQGTPPVQRRNGFRVGMQLQQHRVWKKSGLKPVTAQIGFVGEYRPSSLFTPAFNMQRSLPPTIWDLCMYGTWQRRVRASWFSENYLLMIRYKKHNTYPTYVTIILQLQHLVQLTFPEKRMRLLEVCVLLGALLPHSTKFSKKDPGYVPTSAAAAAGATRDHHDEQNICCTVYLL